MPHDRQPTAAGPLLGIECGATHSVAICADAHLRLIRRAQFGPANLRLLSEPQLLAHLRVIASKMPKPASRQLVVCINSADYPASLERRKIYVALRDIGAEKQGLLRIVDESGEDYLYPKAQLWQLRFIK